MIWLTWRQFRAQALTVLALLAAAAIAFLVTGLRMHHSYTADLAACAPLDACDGATPPRGRSVPSSASCSKAMSPCSSSSNSS